MSGGVVMSLLALAAAAVALAVVVLVLFLIPTILEMRKALAALRSLIQVTEERLEPALVEMREVLADLRIVADATASRAEEVKTVMTALGDTGENIHRINGLISGAMDILHKPAALVTGAKAAGKYILDKMRKKGG
jgi:uncharacterized protein YoxC